MTHERTEELLTKVIDHMVETDGPHNTITKLLNLGFTKEELFDLGIFFDVAPCFEAKDFVFPDVSALERWLKMKKSEAGYREVFREWLTNFFKEGNTVTIYGEEYDFGACWELV